MPASASAATSCGLGLRVELDAGAGRGQQVLGHAAVVRKPGERGTVHAVHVVAGPAGPAQPVGDQRVQDDGVADGQVGDGRSPPRAPSRRSRGRACRAGSGCIRLVPLALDDVQVGAAHAGPADFHDNVERALDTRLGHLVNDGLLVIAMQPDGLHCLPPRLDLQSRIRCRSMPRQMPPFASMLIRVVRARRRCSGIASPLTRAPVAGSISSGAPSPLGRPSSARRCRSRSSAGEGGTSPSVMPGRPAGLVPAASKRPAHQIGAGHDRLAQEVGAQVVQLTDRLPVEGLGEARPGGHSAVDRIRGEVIFEHHLVLRTPGIALTAS